MKRVTAQNSNNSKGGDGKESNCRPHLASGICGDVICLEASSHGQEDALLAETVTGLM